jgi:hypothetical protein
LSPRQQAKVERTANYSQKCAHETIGFWCEWGVSLDAIEKLGLMPDFAAWSCRDIKCEEYGLCEVPRYCS